MRCTQSLCFVLLNLLLWCLPAHAVTLDVAHSYPQPIGTAAQLLYEIDARLTPEQALDALSRGHFNPSEQVVIASGIASLPVWLALEIDNTSSEAVERRLHLETSWLDRIDLYLVEQQDIVRHLRGGDAQPFAQRQQNGRFFSFGHQFSAKTTTTVLIRVELDDPLVLPIYLFDAEQGHQHQLWQGYSYGLLYGAIGSLLAYNLILFVGLRDDRYLLYSLYLASFIAVNVAYTGHGFQYLWPESVSWQKWSNPVLMLFYIISGLLFATRFLALKQTFSSLHRAVVWGCLVLVGAMVFAIVTDNPVMALRLAFYFMVAFPVSMVVMGALSLRSGNRSALFFLLGSISATVGASITALSVMGLLEFGRLGFRAIDIGMLLDVILLALALADRFRISDQQKHQAEALARLDPLTGLNNRRAFYQLVEPIWLLGLRDYRDHCVILLDIDRFKAINDLYGHNAGDQVLVSVAGAISSEVRTGDILARWGGEEFLIFLPETQLDEAVMVAKRIRQHIAHLALEVNGEALLLSASFGVAQNLTEGVNLEGLIAEADRRLYQAKDQGRDRVCWMAEGTSSTAS
ncbi:MAG: diguanylate cyclase [Motiliproteus sp.]